MLLQTSFCTNSTSAAAGLHTQHTDTIITISSRQHGNMAHGRHLSSSAMDTLANSLQMIFSSISISSCRILRIFILRSNGCGSSQRHDHWIARSWSDSCTLAATHGWTCRIVLLYKTAEVACDSHHFENFASFRNLFYRRIGDENSNTMSRSDVVMIAEAVNQWRKYKRNAGAH